MVILLDGKTTSQKIEEKLKEVIKLNNLKIKLSIILVGNNSASEIYVKLKQKKCLAVGIECNIIKYTYDINQDELLNKINLLNKDNSNTGILIQLPLPNHIDTRLILDSVNINKDADGLNSKNLTNILLNNENIVPATPKGVIKLLEEYNINMEGKNVCIIGFSDVVGKPLSIMCLNRGATVTTCHIKTKNLKKHTLNADIIMTATGVPNLIKKDMIKKKAIIVDIGISKINEKVVGDVDFENVKENCSYITPVPGGVGPMTIISLIENLIKLKKIN
jgi:methylenetetrahydrofolate dehydrogenase (NADP+) / methenyltetrahydrofolate cyclohydrolase